MTITIDELEITVVYQDGEYVASVGNFQGFGETEETAVRALLESDFAICSSTS